MNENHYENLLRTYEINAFANVVTAFRAQGELTPKKQKILNHLTFLLNIPIVRVKAEIRRAVNEPLLGHISKSLNGDEDKCDRWREEGQRLCDLLTRLAPQTAYSIVANQIAGESSSSSWKNKPIRFTAEFKNYPPFRRNFEINKLLLTKHESSDDDNNAPVDNTEPKLGRGCRKRKSEPVHQSLKNTKTKLPKLSTSANVRKSSETRKKPLSEIEPETRNKPETSRRKSLSRNKLKTTINRSKTETNETKVSVVDGDDEKGIDSDSEGGAGGGDGEGSSVVANGAIKPELNGFC